MSIWTDRRSNSSNLKMDTIKDSLLDLRCHRHGMEVLFFNLVVFDVFECLFVFFRRHCTPERCRFIERENAKSVTSPKRMHYLGKKERKRKNKSVEFCAHLHRPRFRVFHPLLFSARPRTMRSTRWHRPRALDFASVPRAVFARHLFDGEAFYF